jgi:hypothetical protein
MSRLVRATGAGTALLFAACASTSGQDRPPARAPQEMPMIATLAAVTDAVLSDAAQRTGRKRAELVVESAEAVTWADGSLGCPEPGAMYTMALVPGYRIRVRAGGEMLDYHASERGYFVLCPAGRAVDPAADGVSAR